MLENLKNPFIKVEWYDTPENLTQERVKRVKSYFQKKYNSTNVKVITKITNTVNNTKLKSLDIGDNITDHQYQKTLMKDFIQDNSIDVKWELLDRLDNRVNNQIDKNKQNTIRYNKWYLKKIEFSNFLSFGDNNVIDFTNLDGITVIESNPKNFGGKTTATINLLMFLFFNNTLKTKTSSEVFNKYRDSDDVKVKGYIVIDGVDYVIERKILRKKSRTGEYTIKNELEFYKIDNGVLVNLSGEQRRETETFITSAIGDVDDFLSTILTTGSNLEELIDSKPTARGQILTRFLGLENLKNKEEIAKEIYSEWSKKLLSNTNNITDLLNQNKDLEEQITTIKSDINKINNELILNDKNLEDHQSTQKILLISLNNDYDKELVKINPNQLRKDIGELNNKKQTNLTYLSNINLKEPSEYYLEEEHDNLRKELNELYTQNKLTGQSIKNNEELIHKLLTGNVCPTCNRKLDEVDHTEEIERIKLDVVNLTNMLIDDQNKYNSLIDLEKKYRSLKNELDEYEKNKLRKVRLELEIEQTDLEINKKQSIIDKFEENKKKLDENFKIENQLLLLKTKIDTAINNSRYLNSQIEKHENTLNNIKEKINNNNEIIKKIKEEEELIGIFKTYFTIYGKNGLSKVILKNMIPVLNRELERLLSDSCYFTLELNINEKNELEFLMIDNETRVVTPLTSGSGYERTISSLALRSVLTKVSSLPKPNIIVMDEVFGKVADENLEMVGEFFKKIKNYFEHIFLISHNTLIRNWSDNLIVISKNENISTIDSITTKIN